MSAHRDLYVGQPMVHVGEEFHFHDRRYAGELGAVTYLGEAQPRYSAPYPPSDVSAFARVRVESMAGQPSTGIRYVEVADLEVREFSTLPAWARPSKRRS